jgi:beta-phosphoglucomutase-like phosphatase (HAD superfamily)
MPSAKYQAILFDFDGVLVDSEPIHHRCWQEVLAPYGIELPWQLYADNCIGIVDRAMLSFLCNLATPPLEIETLQPEYPHKKDLFRGRMTAIGIAEDVKALLAELRPNYKLASYPPATSAKYNLSWTPLAFRTCSTRLSMAATSRVTNLSPIPTSVPWNASTQPQR